MRAPGGASSSSIGGLPPSRSGPAPHGQPCQGRRPPSRSPVAGVHRTWGSQQHATPQPPPSPRAAPHSPGVGAASALPAAPRHPTGVFGVTSADSPRSPLAGPSVVQSCRPPRLAAGAALRTCPAGRPQTLHRPCGPGLTPRPSPSSQRRLWSLLLTEARGRGLLFCSETPRLPRPLPPLLSHLQVPPVPQPLRRPCCPSSSFMPPRPPARTPSQCPLLRTRHRANSSFTVGGTGPGGQGSRLSGPRCVPSAGNSARHTVTGDSMIPVSRSSLWHGGLLARAGRPPPHLHFPEPSPGAQVRSDPGGAGTKGRPLAAVLPVGDGLCCLRGAGQAAPPPPWLLPSVPPNPGQRRASPGHSAGVSTEAEPVPSPHHLGARPRGRGTGTSGTRSFWGTLGTPSPASIGRVPSMNAGHHNTSVGSGLSHAVPVPVKTHTQAGARTRGGVGGRHHTPTRAQCVSARRLQGRRPQRAACGPSHTPCAPNTVAAAPRGPGRAALPESSTALARSRHSANAGCVKRPRWRPSRGVWTRSGHRHQGLCGDSGSPGQAAAGGRKGCGRRAPTPMSSGPRTSPLASCVCPVLQTDR